jgi:hypothetical protein
VLGNLLLHNVIDPNLAGVLVGTQMENQMAMMDRFGLADAMSTDQLDEMRTTLETTYSFMGQVKGFGIVLVIYAIFSLIIGAIIKKRDKSLDY